MKCNFFNIHLLHFRKKLQLNKCDPHEYLIGLCFNWINADFYLNVFFYFKIKGNKRGSKIKRVKKNE